MSPTGADENASPRVPQVPTLHLPVLTTMVVNDTPVRTDHVQFLKKPRLLFLLFGVILLLSATSCSDQKVASSTTSRNAQSKLPAGQGVVWPPADGSVTYADPVDAATGFAVEFVGFSNPLVGEFQQGDARSGEVAIRPTATGPITTVLLRQLEGDDSWSVLGGVTDAIVPTAPAAGSVVRSPVTLQGSSTAFEGTVDVAVRSQAKAPPLATGFVTGGSMGQMGPFENTLEFAKSATPDGAIVFSTSSMEDGRVWEATVVSVRFG